MTTILHLSDTQFGSHHRFGAGPASLAESLLRDLEAMRRDVQSSPPPPDLVVLSGDITEHAQDAEFRGAEKFVARIFDLLDLDRDRLVIVPGNHDVNWELCRLEKARGGRAPYPDKWRPFTEFATRVCGTPVDRETFAVRPYAVRNFDSLRLRVAALNSTMAETDKRHHGRCGRAQLQYLADELAKDDEERQLYQTVAVLHHNVRPESSLPSAETLRDADELTRILGPHIDVLLHGHTHDGQSEMLKDGTLVLATGSAAVDAPRRPEEVPNQYQILELGPGFIRRWARRYTPGDDRWVGDTSLSTRGNVWWEDIQLRGHRDSTAATLASLRNHLAWLGVAARKGDEKRFKDEKWYFGEDIARLRQLLRDFDKIVFVDERAEAIGEQCELVLQTITELEQPVPFT